MINCYCITMRRIPTFSVIVGVLMLYLTVNGGIDAHPSQPILKPALTFVDTKQCKDLQDIRNLIPLSTLNYITSKHCMHDAKFRHALKFLKTVDFQDVLDELETSEVYESILSEFADAGISTTYLSHINDILICLLSRPVSETTTTTSKPITEPTVTTTTSTTQRPNGAGEGNLANLNQMGGAMEIAFMLKLGGFIQGNKTENPVTIAPLPATNTSEVTSVDDCDEIDKYDHLKTRTTLPNKNNKILLSTQRITTNTTSKPETTPSSSSPVLVTLPITSTPSPLAFTSVETLKDDNIEEWIDSNEEVEDSQRIDLSNGIKSTGNANITEIEGAGRPSLIVARSVRTYLRDIINAMPRKQLRELLAEKVCEDAEFASFYKLMRSKTFKLNLLRDISTPQLENQVQILKEHYINLRTVIIDIFALFEMGPPEI